MSDERAAVIAIADTQRWLERAVIGLNLCPFAKAVQQKGQIRWVLSSASEPETLATELAREMQGLAAADATLIDTTLLIHPKVLQDFDDYNQFLDIADALLASLHLNGVLQIASFHPQYRFDGTLANDIGNCSNRSPHPMLQLLRESSVDRAVAAFPDAADIYRRNIQTLRRMGWLGWRSLNNP